MSTENQTQAQENPKGPEVGTPEYDAAMVAKFDKATGQEASAVPTRPDHIPEKFWDAEKGEIRVEDLAKSYAELEKSKGKPKEEPTAPEQKPAEGTTDEAAKALADKGLDYDSFSKEFQESGSLSEESYKKLEEAGIPKNMVDAYVAGQQALAAQWENTGFSMAGGKDEYHKMTSWAAENLTNDEKAAFNDAVNGTEASMKLAISGLKQRFESANGKNPNLRGGQSASSSSAGYQSRAQMTADMRNPLYAKDPAFRAQVEAKLAVTTAF